MITFCVNSPPSVAFIPADPGLPVLSVVQMDSEPKQENEPKLKTTFLLPVQVHAATWTRALAQEKGLKGLNGMGWG